jgi:DNA (cytosine-5)-methyltransferase 1
MAQLKVVDLFAGTGAFSYAFEKAGAECVFANDMIESSKTIYDQNFEHKLTLKDLNDIEPSQIPAHDILTGGFPCFVEGTRVLTNSGYKPIEDVNLTDKLLTHSGEFQHIMNLQRKIYNGTLHSIRIKYHPEPIVCTSEHPFYVREKVETRTWNNSGRKYDIDLKFKEPVWKNAEDLSMNDYFGMVVNTQSVIPEFEYSKIINQHKTENIILQLDNLDQWFMMGYFLGDGWIQESKKKDGRLKYIIRFAINNKDEEYVCDRINNVIQITDKKCNTGKCKKFGCANQQWYQILKQFGKYAHGKKIPEWLQNAPNHLINEFIAGYMKADGWVRSDGMYSMATVSPDIALGIQRLFLKIGKLASVTKCHRPPTCVIEGRTVNQRDTYSIHVHHSMRYTSFIEGSYAWFAPANISKYDTENTAVYNFEVETDNSYIVENTIVHNCQPFSIAGHREGFHDKRSNVFWKILEILDYHHPRCIVLENVKNLVTHDTNRTFGTIKKELEARGYHLCFKVLNTAKITGIPQHRERIYIVGLTSKEVFDKFNLDFETKAKTKISELLEPEVPLKYYYTDKSSTWNLVSKAVVKNDTMYQYRRVYVRENKSSECPTLTANMGAGGHNVPLVLDSKGIRKLTPRECFNFQGFPAEYRIPALADSHLYKLAGNAVSVPVVQLIAQRLLPLLQE